jgi:type IV secretory pathway VirJ component
VVTAPVSAQKLPLVELPAVADSEPLSGRPLAFVFSGDGNWAGADKEVAEAFEQAGIPVVGLKARSYLREAPRTPESTAADVSRVLDEYLTKWNRQSLILIGYSRGADLMPFIVNRLGPDLRARIRMVALLDPQPNASFTFHLSDLVRDERRPGDLPVVPEIERMTGLRIVCVYGTKEANSACPLVPPGLMEVDQRPGHHSMGGEGTQVADLLLKRLRP